VAAGERVVKTFQYALIRAVPRIERGEAVNVGVVLYSQGAEYLACRIALDADRLRAIDPAIDLDAVGSAVDAIRAVCEGDPAAGAAAEAPRRDRFGWLTAPRSTVVQPGPIHAGVTDDPASCLEHLFQRLVR
jgi:hypothetical protein